MKPCKNCGSYAINHKHHGRDGSDPDLCDVCYWRERALMTNEKVRRYDWLVVNNTKWSWQPSRYNQDIVSGFAHDGTGYLGTTFQEALIEAMKQEET